MAYIFLDESGQFKKNNSEKYFVVASFTVGDPKRTSKGFRIWRQKKYPKKLHWQSEIKFSDSGLDNKLRLSTLQTIAKLDIRIHYAYFLRSNIPDQYWRKDKLRAGLLYANVIAELLDMYLPVTDGALRVFCDKRHLSGMTFSEFKELLAARFLPLLPVNTIIQIEMVDSTTNPNIQIADWVAGALFQYFEVRPGAEKYLQIFKNNMLDVKGKEMFKGQ